MGSCWLQGLLRLEIEICRILFNVERRLFFSPGFIIVGSQVPSSDRLSGAIRAATVPFCFSSAGYVHAISIWKGEAKDKKMIIE